MKFWKSRLNFKKILKILIFILGIVFSGLIIFLGVKLLYYYQFMKKSPTPFSHQPKDLVLPQNYNQNTKKIKVPILVYHHIKETTSQDNQTEKILSISSSDFEAQLKFLRFWGYNSINLANLFEAFYQDKELLPHPIIITFDDGYKDFKTNAYPILEKYGFSATIFIITDKVGQKGYLSWDDLKELEQKGIELASHTKTHPHLTFINQQKAKKELQESKEILEEQLKHKIYFLSYPYGLYNSQIINQAKEVGYLLAATLHYNNVQIGNSPFELNRIELRGDKDYKLYRFIAKIWKFNYKNFFTLFPKP